ncbi:MAG: chemotaxis protein CheR [Alphaproteobacteria bacterium]|nr:chemotaxis protein CheR [Alphaproteobacteria bacterium]
MKPQAFDVLAACLRNGSGLVIGPDKLYLLEARLGRSLKNHGLRDLDALAERIAADRGGALTREVIEAMTTNESFFFRDDKPFVHFRTHALPRLLATRPPGAKLRIWSAASSSGQEAYSLAMTLAECRAQIGGRSIEIVGTDISREQLARAQEGLYTQFEVQRGLPMQFLVRYFRKEGPNWRLNDAIRAMASFREFNLLADLRMLGQFDIVFCRNVLIYFDQPTKSRVLEAIARQMPPDGLLYLGGAETVLGITNRFAAAPGERGVYEIATAAAKAAPALARAVG